VSGGWEAAWYPEGGRASPAARLLTPFSWLFGAGVAARSALYDAGLLRPVRVEGLHVISVGNLTVGGSGKTPVVRFLAEGLRARGLSVAILSRGYGRNGTAPLRVEPFHTAADVGDEPLLLSRTLPDVPVYVGADRVVLARRARDAGAQVALLDDGFQHRRLARDVDLLVVDALSPLGNGRLLPAGPLREPAAAARRATAVWLRCASPDAPVPSPFAHLPVLRARHVPWDVLDAAGASLPLGCLSGRRVLAFAGLARPSGFLSSLRALGAEVVSTRLFQDHHAFRPEELRVLAAEAASLGATPVTTEKDRVRLDAATLGTWTLRQRVELLSGREWWEGLARGGTEPHNRALDEHATGG
jgi:tetraacyldisaccharide 4'-kinase